MRDRIITNCDPREASCPIVRHNDLGHNKLYVRTLGTVFFIGSAGVFLTAKHVVEDYSFGLNGELALMLLREPHYKFVKVGALQHHPTVDISIGMVDLSNEGWKPKTYKLATKELAPGDLIGSFGYAKTEWEMVDERITIKLNPDFYDGMILRHHPEGYTIARWPVYSHTMNTPSGNSGGPVFSQKTTAVHGICCTGFDPPPGGTCSDVREILDWRVEFVRDSWNTIRGIAQHRPDMISLDN